MALPVVTYDQEMGLHFNGEDIRLVHLPGGHTDGDSAVFFAKANTVHLGDNFFNRMLPFVDLDAGGTSSCAPSEHRETSQEFEARCNDHSRTRKARQTRRLSEISGHVG